MNWGAPKLLPWLLVLLPAAAILFVAQRARLRRLGALIAPELWSRINPEWLPRRVYGRLAWWLLALLFFGAALARPQWGFTWREIRRTGLDVMVVVDTSRSMLATDMRPNRLQQAKWALRDLVGYLRGDRVGLVVFAGLSYLQCPLTSDYAAFMMYVDDIHVGLVPRGGTAIADALRTAANSFEDASAADRIIVLVTDGEDTVGDPLAVIPFLQEKNIKVYAIGVGSPEGELIPIQDESGRETFLRDRDGQLVKSSLNEEVLQRLALSTGGAYIRAAPGQFGFERLVRDEWSKLRPAEGETQRLKMWEDRAGWLIGAGLLCLIIEAWRRERSNRSLSS
ncbi:MAG TPA: VWA domain-containing protein [Kiritimatiellia bacterium]|nr:VWA domain-containing protein [Kiritimatiellia bacterium]HMO98616.1 VWA domain-containing protein [Kiritimatiellia bacterium]HMP96356.1 VWA domain-containing protein [Kiritimatiellia bacterium]